jgi:hypothetical protein
MLEVSIDVTQGVMMNDKVAEAKGGTDIYSLHKPGAVDRREAGKLLI